MGGLDTPMEPAKGRGEMCIRDRDTFRIGTIGEVYEEDIEKLAAIIYDFLRERKGETA